MSTKHFHIIGAGFAGLAAACHLASMGHQVTLLEKHNQVGGRARQWSVDGFQFDMGPSWYWMPDVLDDFFQDFGKRTSDYYDLVQLDPGFTMFFGDSSIAVPQKPEDLIILFESIEKGSGEKLRKFLKDAETKYQISMKRFVHKLSHSPLEYLNLELLQSALRLDLFSSLGSIVKRDFQDARLRQLLEFSVLFLGATADDTPGMYNLMNHAGLSVGTFYPMGGMSEVPRAMAHLATELGVKIRLDAEVSRIDIVEGVARSLTLSSSEEIVTDGIIAAADYHHVEQHLIPPQYRRYDDAYWDKRTMSPSSLLFYVGVNKKIPKLNHHTLFFDADLNQHTDQIYDIPAWPEDPLFYACCPSKTDPSTAPEGFENLFLLVPLAPGLSYQEKDKKQCFDNIFSRLEQYSGTSLKEHIVVQRSYGVSDFETDYHAYKGNAYGLANTLYQTAFLKPKMKSLVRNIIFAGQLTVPGPGMPPAIISGKIAAHTLLKNFQG